MKLLFASKNPGKIEEVRKALAEFEILSLYDFPSISDIEENGATYEENALLKAKICFEKTGMFSLGDDVGFEVEHLGGEPGIHSHRWLGDAATDYDCAIGIVKLLEGVPRERRTERLGGTMVYWDGVQAYTAI